MDPASWSSRNSWPTSPTRGWHPQGASGSVHWYWQTCGCALSTISSGCPQDPWQSLPTNPWQPPDYLHLLLPWAVGGAAATWGKAHSSVHRIAIASGTQSTLGTSSTWGTLGTETSHWSTTGTRSTQSSHGSSSTGGAST